MNIFERIRASEKLRMPILDDTQISIQQPIGPMQAHVGRWRSLQARATKRGLLSTLLTVGSLTLLVKFVAAGKEIIVARQLGVGDAIDAFLIAYALPSLAMNIIATSFNSALIPTYVQVRESEGKSAAQRLFSSVMSWNLGLLLLTSALLAILFPLLLPFLASSFGPGKLAFTRSLFWVLLPIITITGLTTTWGAVLNAEGEFALPAATPIITSLVVTVFLFCGAQVSGAWGLAVGTLVGACLEAALIGRVLWRHGVSLRPQWSGMDADLRQVIHQHAPLAAATLIFSGNVLADQVIAANLGSGSVAALNYGTKIVTMVIGVTATAVSTSVLPHFSRRVANGEWKSLHRDMRNYTFLILLTLIPLALLMVSFSIPIVKIGFQRGAFTSQDTRLVAHVQACFALKIPFYTVGMMYLRLLSALKLNRHTFSISAAGLVLNLVLDIVFAKFFGVAGIALSTTVVALAWSGTSYLFLNHAIRDAMTEAIPHTVSQQ